MFPVAGDAADDRTTARVRLGALVVAQQMEREAQAERHAVRGVETRIDEAGALRRARGVAPHERSAHLDRREERFGEGRRPGAPDVLDAVVDLALGGVRIPPQHPHRPWPGAGASAIALRAWAIARSQSPALMSRKLATVSTSARRSGANPS